MPGSILCEGNLFNMCAKVNICLHQPMIPMYQDNQNTNSNILIFKRIVYVVINVFTDRY